MNFEETSIIPNDKIQSDSVACVAIDTCSKRGYGQTKACLPYNYTIEVREVVIVIENWKIQGSFVTL